MQNESLSENNGVIRQTYDCVGFVWECDIDVCGIYAKNALLPSFVVVLI